MYMDHDGPPDPKPRGSSGYLPGGVSGEKPAPTAAEVAAARQHATWLRDQFTERTRIEDMAVTLLAALDAAEARAETAENHSENLHSAWAKCLKLLVTAERERDELSDALRLYEAFPELATGDTARRDEQRAAYNGLRWVLGLLAGLDDGRQDSVAKAFRPVVEKIKRERDEARAALKPGAIVVSDSEETRERIARELWGGEGYSEPWGEAAKNSHPVTYRCVLRDTDAVLAALRESRP